MIKIKKTECLELGYRCSANKSSFMVESELQFSAQTPTDESLLERAILIRFQVKGKKEDFIFNCVFRVIFSFDTAEEMIDGKEFIEAHQQDAYMAMQKMAKDVLKTIGQSEKVFPDIDFE